MRSIKSSRGRGMGEAQIAVWLYSMPATSEINCAMQEATDSKYQTSEQHAESSRSRIMRDNDDTGSFLNFLREHSPFTEDPNLRNIKTGEVADKASNCDEAKTVGEEIIKKMKNTSVMDYSLKRREQIVWMSLKSKEAKETLCQTIDPQLMFQ
ncbi:hypothetical protein FSP39_006400 [Pinctada imbricata]|uniref:Uncharacterized protein n=1 Tax=Pinctada imbricata TaxID=66713 RepID=A0AA89BW80_PINIB|nr:hypothetical protein FSP39_006400 [Pinctada imbricata]